MSEHPISDADYTAALSRGRTEAATQLRARAVRYLADRDVLEIETTRAGGFLIPRAWIGALQEIPAHELERLEFWPIGSAIELEARDIHISVDALLTDVLPAPLPESALAANLLRLHRHDLRKIGSAHRHIGDELLHLGPGRRPVDDVPLGG